MTQPEGEKNGRVREECCAFKKKAVVKNLEFPVAFEPTLEGIVAAAAASGRSCDSRKKGFGQKTPKNKQKQNKKLLFPGWEATSTRPLSTESETSHDFKKSCLGQKQSGEDFSLSALDLIRNMKDD